MMDIFYFYKTTNLINGKFYYGSGSSTKPYFGSGLNIISAVKKYGIDNFQTKQLRFFDSREKAYSFEDRFLKLYKISENKNSYNIKNAGLGGDPFTNNPNKEELRERYRRSMKLQMENPERRALCNSFRGLEGEALSERKKVWSEAAKGSKNGRYKYDKPVEQYDKIGNLVKIWDDVSTISRENSNLNHKYLVMCCKGKLKTHGGFVWKWIG